MVAATNLHETTQEEATAITGDLDAREKVDLDTSYGVVEPLEEDHRVGGLAKRTGGGRGRGRRRLRTSPYVGLVLGPRRIGRFDGAADDQRREDHQRQEGERSQHTHV